MHPAYETSRPNCAQSLSSCHFSVRSDSHGDAEPCAVDHIAEDIEYFKGLWEHSETGNTVVIRHGSAALNRLFQKQRTLVQSVLQSIEASLYTYFQGFGRSLAVV
jgi:hypothetical protein